MHYGRIGTVVIMISTVQLIALGTAAPVTNTPNNLYSEGGTYTLSMIPYYNTATTTLNPFSFPISLSRTQPNTSYHFGYAIQEVNSEITSQKLNISVYLTSKTSSQVTMSLYTSHANKINVLNINHILLQPLFGVYTFIYHQLAPMRSLHSGDYYEENVTGVGPLNMTGGLTTWSTIVGFDSTLTNNQIDLYVSVSTPNSTTATFRVSTISNQYFYLNTIIIGSFIYNSAQLSALPRHASFSTGTLSSTTTLTYSSGSIRPFNTIVGLQSYHITNKNFYQYKITITNSTSISISTNVTTDYKQYDYLLMNFVYCDNTTTPYFYVSQNTCHTTCPTRTYYDQFYMECYTCLNVDCYYCNQTQLCTQCSDNDHRQMNNNRCTPKDGYYESGTSVAAACDPTLCLTCTSPTYCLSCQDTKYLTSSHTCQPCISNCIKCTSASSCLQCTAGYTYTSSNNSCWLNCSSISGCITCSYSSSFTCNSCTPGYSVQSNQCVSTTCPWPNCSSCTPSKCLTCSSGYVLVSSYLCSAVCGDGLIISPAQQCDDGNTADNDGCSNQCKVQQGFTCSSVPSQCSITTLTITLASINKDTDANSFTIVYNFSPGRHNAYAGLDWNSVIQQESNLSLSFTYIQYDVQTASLTISADYHQNINKNQLKLTITTPNTLPFNHLPAQHISSTLVTSNNLKLAVFEGQTYSHKMITQLIAISITIGALIIFLLGYYAGKLIAIQLMFLLQLTFYCLSTIEDLTPTFQALTSLQYSKGYNLSLLPPSTTVRRQLSSQGLKAQLLSNYNVVLGLLALPALAALITFTLNYFCFKSENDTLARLSRKLLGQYTFYGILYSLYTVSISIGIAVVYIPETGTNNNTTFIVGAFLALILIIYAVMLVKNSQIMGEFSSSFKKQSNISSFFILFQTAIVVLQSISILVYAIGPQLSLVLGLKLVQLIVMIKAEPYKHRIVRAALNVVASMLITTIILLYEYIEPDIPSYGVYSPYFILGILCFVFVYSIYFLILEVLERRKENNKVVPEKQDKLESLESKRKLKKEQRDKDLEVSRENLKEEEEERASSGKQSTKASIKLKPEKIKQMHQDEVKAHIDKLNADFMVDNPFVHAFRGGPPARPSRQPKPTVTKPQTTSKGESQLVNQLLSLKESLAAMKKRK